MLARAGLVLGPYEYPGRLPWWLQRVCRHRRVLAPGSPGRAVQFIDVRDLASWLLHRGHVGSGGVFNLTAPHGHTTMGELLVLCQRVVGTPTRLYWVEDEQLLACGVRPWDEVPLWIPQRAAEGGVYDVDVSRALGAGASFRPAVQTVADTWSWLTGMSVSRTKELIDDRPWLARAREVEILQDLRHR